MDSIPVGVEKNSLKVSTFDLRTKPVTIISSTETTAFETFIPEFIKVCEKSQNVSINVLDAEKLFENEVFKVNYYKENFDEIFKKIYSYIEKLNETYISNNYNVDSIKNCQDLLIIIVGITQFKNKLSPDLQDKLDSMITMIKDLRKISIVIVDVIDNIKSFEYENWFKTVVSSNHGIWIGDGISDQYTIKLSKNPKYIKEEIGNRFGYAIKKGNPILIKVLNNSDTEEDDDDE